MKTREKVAFIAGIFALITALINYFALTKSEKPFSSSPSIHNPAPVHSKPERVIQMSGPYPTYIEGDQNNNGRAGGGK